MVSARVAPGTRDFSVEPGDDRARRRWRRSRSGDAIAAELAVDGCDLLGVGEMGIGNTTASSAIVAALTRSPGRATSPVAGPASTTTASDRKAAVIETALALHRPDPSRPLDVLAAVGGLEIAAHRGRDPRGGRPPRAGRPRRVHHRRGGPGRRAARAGPAAPRLIASHRSVEPGHRIVLDALGLEPILDLGLRLGEGSGAALAIPVIGAAARILGEMATFEDAGVADRD